MRIFLILLTSLLTTTTYADSGYDNWNPSYGGEKEKKQASEEREIASEYGEQIEEYISDNEKVDACEFANCDKIRSTFSSTTGGSSSSSSSQSSRPSSNIRISVPSF